jgi:hypothetical protein
MKISMALALLILALGVPIGWRERLQLASARERHAQLVSKVAQSGITHDPTRRRDGVRGTRREHENKEEVAKKLAADFIAAGEKNGKLDEATQDKMSELLARVASLDAAQLKALFTEILASTELTRGARRKLLFSLAEIASDHPRAALVTLTESINLSNEADLAKDLISASLSKWAKEDPTAVLEWVRKNGAIFSKLVDENSKVRIISSAAENHPALAFQLVDGLGLAPKDKNAALSEIAKAPETAQDRTVTLAAISAHLASLPAGQARDQMSNLLIPGILTNAVWDGFDAATQWLDGAGLTPEQLDMSQVNLLWQARLDETGKWVEWMGKTQPGGQSDWYMSEMVNHWTRKDPQAAGKWLASTPDSPTKNTFISTFAKSVSRHDPEAAAQWAMTLPPGEDRSNTLKKIYENWPKHDEAAKETFAEKHRLK